MLDGPGQQYRSVDDEACVAFVAVGEGGDFSQPSNDWRDKCAWSPRGGPLGGLQRTLPDRPERRFCMADRHSLRSPTEPPWEQGAKSSLRW